MRHKGVPRSTNTGFRTRLLQYENCSLSSFKIYGIKFLDNVAIQDLDGEDHLMKPRLILIDSERSKHIQVKDKDGVMVNELTISGVEASRNIFKGTETMIELKGFEFTLEDWTLTGNGPRPKGNAPGQLADDDTNESFIQVYIGYDQTVLV